jgi:hypothetical protein
MGDPQGPSILLVDGEEAVARATPADFPTVG